RGTGDIDAGKASAVQTRISVMQSSPRSLEAQLVEKIPAKSSRVLSGDVPISSLLVRGAVSGVLAERLILRVHLQPGHRVRRNHATNECAVRAVPDVIESQRIDVAFFRCRIVADYRCQSLECGRQRRAILGK